MSTINHLRRAVKILRDAFEDEIADDGDWFWNLKHWTINFYETEVEKSVVAYRVNQELNVTQWDDYVVIEHSVAEWKTLV